MKIQEIRAEVNNFLSDPENNYLSLDSKINTLFKKLNFDSTWCVLINFFTMGWYDDHNKGLIRQELTSNSSFIDIYLETCGPHITSWVI